MHSVQANTIMEFAYYISYNYWMSVCAPLAGLLTFFTALFFGDYVTAFYNGMDFCSGVILNNVQL